MIIPTSRKSLTKGKYQRASNQSPMLTKIIAYEDGFGMQVAPRSTISQTLDLSLIGGTPLLLLFLILPGFMWGGVFYVLPALFAFAIVPVLDATLPLSQATQRKQDLSPRTHMILSSVPTLYTFIFLGIFAFQLSRLQTLTGIELIYVILSFSAMGTVLTAAGHELIHKRHTLLKAIGEIPFVLFGYWHFPVAHIKNHHAFVATEQDNHAPDIGDTYWHYLVTSYPKAVRFSYNQIVRQQKTSRARRLGMAKIAIYVAVPWACIALCFQIAGWAGVVFYCLSALLSLMIAEAAFYLQHYGLGRSSDDQVAPHLIWDSYHRFSNYLIFMVPRHADHHMNWQKDYYLLQCYDDSQRLPVGYPTLVALAFIPPLFFAMMNRRVPGPPSLGMTEPPSPV